MEGLTNRLMTTPDSVVSFKSIYFNPSRKYSLKELTDDWNQGQDKPWQDRVLAHYASGKGDVQLRATVLPMSQNLWRRLMIEEPEFAEVIRHGRELSLAWLYNQGLEGIWDQDEAEFKDGRPVSRKTQRMNAKVLSLMLLNMHKRGDTYEQIKQAEQDATIKNEAEAAAKQGEQTWADQIKDKL